MNYYIDGELAVGRFEICMEGRWSPICQDSWSERDASVACNQLGFSRAGKASFYLLLMYMLMTVFIPLVGAINGNQRFTLNSEDSELIQVNFNCTGEEDSLKDCSPFTIMSDAVCGERRSAYIVCQGNSLIMCEFQLICSKK